MTRTAALAVTSVLMLVISCGGNSAQHQIDQCNDGIDNDGDGLVDYPADPGCSDPNDDSEDTAGPPQCSDGVDNDGDGKIDYPNDPGCTSPNQDTETDDCPDGPGCPQCSNGIDDDLNGLTDYPADPGCSSAADFTESASTADCGASMFIKTLPASHEDTYTLDGTSTMVMSSPCGGGNGVPAIAYRLVITQPAVILATTNDPATMINTIIDIRGSSCGTEIACNDNITPTNLASTASASVTAGEYFIIVEAQNGMAAGTFHLRVDVTPGLGQACTGPMDCGAGLVCRIALGDTMLTCEKPVCSDGVDDDGDGKLDFPDDPGCATPDDNDETDDCPSGPNCPACSNGLDDDGDGQTDYPADTSCTSAATPTESCNGERDPILTIDGPLTMGTLVGAHDDENPTCTSQTGGVDVLLAVTVPPLTSMHVDDLGSSVSDTTMSLLPATCGPPVIACDDDTGASLLSTIDTGPLAGGTYLVVVDAYNSGVTPAPFQVNFSGQLTPGAKCDTASTMNGALVCPTGTFCSDDPLNPGSLICNGPQCNDGRDNDGDGLIDYPNDPGCDNPGDDDETDDCPSGPTCPACGNGLDDDGDGLIDYPADPSCTSAAGGSESCNGEQDPILTIAGPSTTGDLTTAHDDHLPACGCSYDYCAGQDQAFTLTVPALSSLHLDTAGSTTYDNILSLLPAACSEPSLACAYDFSGDTSLDTGALAAGTYVVYFDNYESYYTAGSAIVNLSGTLQLGVSCEPANTLGGALTCPPDTACMGTPGSRTCIGAFQCNNGIDDDGDGKIDFPNDPGCAAGNDDDESDDCPSGSNCPACANGIDDDGDGKIDYPADTGCKAASTLIESCDAEVDPIAQVTGAVTNGTLVGAHDNYTPPSTCAYTYEGPDVDLVLKLPTMASLHLDTEGSSVFDTVMTLLPSSCGDPAIACNDDTSGSDYLSTIDIIDVTAGTYVVSVEVPEYYDTLGPFTLNVSGQIAVGQPCDAANNLGGALTCVIGSSCMAGTCQP
ncbi:MAG TPA: hypothetical protein VGF94_23225 [Kofleriaceae bacterium]|jgi:hypothetical protein